jgi:ferredoxin-like protein FixX
MMDAVEFLNKVDRLSKRGSTEEKMRYNDYRTARDNTRAVKFVERWDAEHPVKTRQSEFLKLFPNAQTDSGCLNACPMDVFGNTGIDCNKRTCFECKKAFWLAEVEDV